MFPELFLGSKGEGVVGVGSSLGGGLYEIEVEVSCQGIEEEELCSVGCEEDLSALLVTFGGVLPKVPSETPRGTEGSGVEGFFFSFYLSGKLFQSLL